MILQGSAALYRVKGNLTLRWLQTLLRTFEQPQLALLRLLLQWQPFLPPVGNFAGLAAHAAPAPPQRDAALLQAPSIATLVVQALEGLLVAVSAQLCFHSELWLSWEVEMIVSKHRHIPATRYGMIMVVL